MNLTLSGRKAIVTGGSKGLGFATAKAFAEAGADVAILARDLDTLNAAAAEIERSAKGRVSSRPATYPPTAAFKKASMT